MTGATLYLAAYAALIPVPAAATILRGGAYNIPGIVSLCIAPAALHRSRGRERAGWFCVIAVAAFWLAAEAIYALYAIRGVDAGVPALPDVFYYLGYGAFMGAVVLLAPGRRRLADRRSLLDGAVVMIASAAVGWDVILAPLHDSSTYSRFAQAVVLGYPILDLGLLVTLIVSFYGSTTRFPRAMLALVAAALCTIAGDVPYLLDYGADARYPAWVDLGWLAGYWCLALALYEAGHGSRARFAFLPRTRAQSIAGLVLPYVAVAPAGIATLVAAFIAGMPSVLMVGSSLALVLLLLRQWVTLLENRRLTAALEREIAFSGELVDQLEARAAELEQLEARARYDAEHDHLTGLYNRRAWFARAAQPGVTAVAIVDIDFFKRVNDVHGHPAGDHVLKEVAWRLEGLLGHGATIGRLGGEEFAACFTVPYAEAEDACLGLVETIATIPVALASGEELAVSVSCGLAPNLGAGHDAIDASYELADGALYDAKQGGRRRLVARTPLAAAA